jgi:hypothetical protein
MGCYVRHELVAHYGAIGITSIKPKLGRGNGGAHSYTTFHRDQGFVAYGYMTYTVVRKILQQIHMDETKLYANVLEITTPRENLRERRHTYIFFGHDADWLIFKTHLSQLDPELITDDRGFKEPRMFPLRRK